MINSRQRWDVITGKYKPELKTDMTAASDAMKAADKGDFAGYIMAQGGPFVSRKDLLIRNDYEGIAQGNEYGEFVMKLQGFQVVGDESVNTRLRNWKIQPKSQELLDHEARTSGAEGAEVLNSPAGASRSSVNNCTRPLSDSVDTQLKAILRRRGINLDDHLLEVVGQGAQIRVDKDQTIKLKPRYYVDGHYHPPELVDVKPDEPKTWSGWNSSATSKQDKTELADSWETWESWNWG